MSQDHSERSQQSPIPLEPVLTQPEKTAVVTSSTATLAAEDHRPSTSHSLVKNGFDTDIESQIPPSRLNSNDGSTIFNRKNDQQVWPCKQQWQQRAQVAKRNRMRRCGWTPWQNWSKRNRFITKVVVILLIVGIAVGIGFGLSKSLGAPLWGKHS